MNLSKLQSEAVKQIDDLNWDTDKGVMTKAKLIKQSTGETVGQITLPVTKEMIKTFIADQIQKAVEETRKEDLKEFKDGTYIISYFEDKLEEEYKRGVLDGVKSCKEISDRLSIQSKGKMK